MKNIIISFKSLLTGLGAAALCTIASAGNQVCPGGGYITRVVVGGMTNEDNIIGITIKDRDGNLSNWTSYGLGDTNNHAWTRALLATALTAYVTQSFVYVAMDLGPWCTSTETFQDGHPWHRHWRGLVLAPPGSY